MMMPEVQSVTLLPRGWLKPKLMFGVGLCVAVGMMILGGFVLYDARQDAWHQAEKSANNLLLALSRDIARNIAILDLSLQGVIEALTQPDINQASPAVRHQAIFDRAASAEDLGSILALDVAGYVVEDSTSLSPNSLNLADRDYFQIHKDRADVGLYISRPYRSRLRNGDPSISVSRRLATPSGRFDGVVAGSLSLNFFKKLFQRLELGSEGAITLLRSDGRIVIRQPYNEADIDRDLSRGENFKYLSQAESGQYTARSQIDGVERLIAFRKVGNLPLILSVSLSTQEIYAAWRRKAFFIGAIIILLSAATIGASLLFQRELTRRLSIESELKDAAEKLKVVAATDGLTGLANRRAFDDEIAREWERAVRRNGAISLLMLDIDHFKIYNDAHGHPAGDDILRAVASALMNWKRVGDTAARYGGEEFVILLPDTAHAGALIVAERILAGLAILNLPHQGGVDGKVTASIGTASYKPRVGDRWEHLIKAADDALYQAKAQGRNRFVCGKDVMAA
jgi:diguanylate cyclase (GGDEF)-like protein